MSDKNCSQLMFSFLIVPTLNTFFLSYLTIWRLQFGHHWFRYLLIDWRHHAIIWTNVELSSIQSAITRLWPIVLEMLKTQINRTCCKITNLKLLLSLTGKWVNIKLNVLLTTSVSLIYCSHIQSASATVYNGTKSSHTTAKIASQCWPQVTNK